MAHVAAFVQAHPVRQAELKRIGVVVDFTRCSGQSVAQAVGFHLFAGPLRQGLKPSRQAGSTSLKECCSSGTAAEVDAWSQQLPGLGFDAALPLPDGGGLHLPQSHVVGREEHAIQATADSFPVAGDHDQIGAGVVYGH